MAELKYPKNERLWMTYYNIRNELVFILTSRQDSREWYYLYERNGDGFKKLGKAKTPPELESRFDVHERLRKA